MNYSSIMKFAVGFAAVILSSISAAQTNVLSSVIFDSSSNRVVRSGWVNIDEAHYLKGKKLTPEYLNDRIVIVHRWCSVCPGIAGAIKEFGSIKFPANDVVLLTSYFPDAPHSRDMVMQALKDNKVSSSVYVGASLAGEKFTSRHRATYVVLPGSEVAWSMTHNTCIDELKNAIRKELPVWRIKVIENLSETRPGLALLRLKECKKLHPKESAALKELQTKLEVPEVRTLSDFEKSLLALPPNASTNKIKELKNRLQKFRESCSMDYCGEIDKMIEELDI